MGHEDPHVKSLNLMDTALYQQICTHPKLLVQKELKQPL
jgi:hypothetical protein